MDVNARAGARRRPAAEFVVARCSILVLLFTVTAARTVHGDDLDVAIAATFRAQVRPFLQSYCLPCHGERKQEASLDLSVYSTVESVTRGLEHWQFILERLVAGEMPPEEAEAQPADQKRQEVIEWITRLRKREAARNAGDPGLVLARRLSNAEFDYTIHDLTGVDIRPTREFPVDPANEAGFANSGESLAMSPALLHKYLDAARHVADHVVLTPTGIHFAPHPVVAESDRDKYCVQRIVDFYKRQPVDYADYFFAAWRFKHRAEDSPATLADIARAERVSPRYLATVWDALTGDRDHAGPLAELRDRWTKLPGHGGDRSAVRDACVKMRDFVIRERARLVVPLDKSAISGLNRSLQPAILWLNHQMAANRRRCRLPAPDGERSTELEIAATVSFCSIFPDAFYVSERGRMFLDAKERNSGRLLSAGFHLMVGYFRDDDPLYDMILDEDGQRELDSLWRELDFVTRAPMRQFRDFIYFERAESTRYLAAEEFDFARSEDDNVTSPEKMNRVAQLFIARAHRDGKDPAALEILDEYFSDISAHVRRVEVDLAKAPERHVGAVVQFAERAWRRPLSPVERDELRQFYAQLRSVEQLPHEDAIRDVVASIVMSPRFSYRIDPPPAGDQTERLSPFALANRLSYFLWSSMPDEELRAHAAAGDLDDHQVLVEQTRRMMADPRVRRLAVEFGGHWLDIRQFEQHNAVDRGRFPSFTDDLRQAMFEEPVRFFVDLVHRDGSVLELLDADHTFVNPVLAEHYGIPTGNLLPHQWMRVDDAHTYGRGGLLAMSVFLTKNSPGLRTSPVKRGYWIVRRVLGEHIPAPPADVPELPDDESQLGDRSLRQVLAQHRSVPSCAACHNRFDSIGLVFEGYGPIGERRDVDLGGRNVDDRAEFPDGTRGNGLEGLRHYLKTARQDEFLDNLCRKFLAYALGRSLLLSDESTIEAMRANLEANDYRFGRMVETIVTSRQFLTRRGRDD